MQVISAHPCHKGFTALGHTLNLKRSVEIYWNFSLWQATFMLCKPH